MTTLAIVILAAAVIVLVVRDKYIEASRRVDAVIAWDQACADRASGDDVRLAQWEAHVEQAIKVTEAPAGRRIMDIIAANEASRCDLDAADWTEPAPWREQR